jgi:hypothetical protein
VEARDLVCGAALRRCFSLSSTLPDRSREPGWASSSRLLLERGNQMKLRYVFAIVLVTGLAGWYAGNSVAEDKPDAGAEEDMMAKMMAEGMPGPMHKHLDHMAGEWTTDGTFWMGGPEPLKSKGTSTITWVNGGRFLDIQYHGPFAGMDFKGRGYMGHNNPKKQFEMIWVDNFGSGIDFKTGTCSEDGKVLTLEGFWEGPMGKLPTKQIYKAIDANSWSLTAFTTMEGKEMKEMEIIYTRKAK